MYTVLRNFLLSLLVAMMIFFIGLYIYNDTKKYEKQEQKLQELYNNHSYLQKNIQELVNKNNNYKKNIEELTNGNDYYKNVLNEQIKKQNIKETEEKDKNIKPGYEYLKSVSVFLFDIKEKIIQVGHTELHGAVGSGSIISKNSVYTYILTNKHVCDKSSIGTCSIMLEDKTIIYLEFVKQSQSNYDMSLWRTEQNIPNKYPIKGIAKLKQQDKVYSVGNYLGLREIYTEGTVAGEYDRNILLLNLPCAYGCSGSGVFDKEGNLTGLIFAGVVINEETKQVETAKILAINTNVLSLFLKDII